MEVLMDAKKAQVRYTDEFNVEAVSQVTERGHSVADVARRLGVTAHSLYAWMKCQAMAPDQRARGARICSQSPESRDAKCKRIEKNRWRSMAWQSAVHSA